MTKAKVGDYIVYSYKGTEETTPRLVTEVTDEVVRFEEYYNSAEREYVTGYTHDAYRIVHSAPDTTASEDDSLDIIANLIRRVASLEQQLRDTQNNVERQGVEIANIEAVTKAPQSGAKLLADAFEALAKYERSVGM